MYFKHKIYGKLFNIFTQFPIVDNRISFVMDSDESFKGNLEYIKNEFEKRGSYEFNYFYKDKLSFSNFKKLATSKFVFLNDNFYPIAYMNFKNDTKVIQLWHAPGAFKKFGASVESDVDMISKISSNIDYLIITSKHIMSHYSKAFQMDKSKIKALGLPRADYYFENHDIDSLRRNFNRKYPKARGKKIVLYAPTFREEEKYNNIFNYLNLKDFNDKLSNEYVLALRLHPKVKNFYSGNILAAESYIDCSDYESEQELFLLSDILITDYSSVMIEFALLDKPIVFFVYDYDNYLNNERGFYFDFKENAPGSIVYNSNQLIEVIKRGIDKSKTSRFISTQFDYIDGQASKRVVDFLLNGGVENE